MEPRFLPNIPTASQAQLKSAILDLSPDVTRRKSRRIFLPRRRGLRVKICEKDPGYAKIWYSPKVFSLMTLPSEKSVEVHWRETPRRSNPQIWRYFGDVTRELDMT
ncbi:hypothetical protein Bbelb_180230 [Branchiostoma belcheri]|nr:hypothetical protein Bbelb_180230 [Branchiostoma belcheri]